MSLGGNTCYQSKVVSLRLHCRDSRGQHATMGVTDGGEEIPLNMVRPCSMEVPLSETLDMSESSHLTISYLLRD